MSYLMSLMYKSNNERWYIQHEIQSEMHMISSHAINKIKVVKAFVKEHELVKHYNTLRQESHDVDNKNKLFQSINQIINGWFGLGTKILLTWMAGIIILTNSDTDINSNSYNTNLTVGLFVTFQTYWYRLYSTLQGMEKTFSSYDQAFFMAKKIFRTLAKKASIEHSIVDKIKNEKVQNLKNEINGNIEFKNVEFFYESAPKKLVLKKLNFEIEKGKTTALVGRSGGGKSTIMHLILRFYDPTKGIITINNIDLKQYNPYALRRQIALVSQDTELFHKSMEYNIGYGGNKEINNEYESMYNLEQVEYASKLANAHKFISEMDEKYDTKMGSRANRCSGGQKQRISIARMLMSKPKIMLLDEATSSLDAESEALVQAAMERECEQSNCTLVIVAHRLSTVVNADKICVVDEGQVVESGTHEELLEMKGIYASLVERQINLRSKMKEKLEKIKNGENNDEKEDEKDDDDFDNIDKLIDQIKAEKEEKVKKEKENEKEDKIDDKIENKLMNDVIIYIHGGGYSLCGPSHIGYCSRLSLATNTKILFIDYSKPPNCSIPKQVDEILTAYFYILSQLNNNNNKIVIGGDSAGAGLCCLVLQKLSFLGLSDYHPIGTLLYSPFIDLTLKGSSWKKFANKDMIVAEGFASRSGLLAVGNDEKLLRSPFFSAIYAPDYEIKSNVMLFVSTDECLYDDAKSLLKKLRITDAE
eukprot:890519_1